MYRNIFYLSYCNYNTQNTTGDIFFAEAQVLGVMRFYKIRCVAEDVFADAVVYIRDNWEKWNSSLGPFLLLKLGLKLKRSYNVYRKCVNTELSTVDFEEISEGYLQLKEHIQNMGENLENTRTWDFINLNNTIDGEQVCGNISNTEYIFLKRSLFNLLHEEELSENAHSYLNANKLIQSS